MVSFSKTNNSQYCLWLAGTLKSSIWLAKSTVQSKSIGKANKILWWQNDFYLHMYKQLIAQLNFSAAELSRLCHESFDLQFFIVESIKEWNKETKSPKSDADETKAIVVPFKVPDLKHLPPLNFRSENLCTNLVKCEWEGRDEATIGKKPSVSFFSFRQKMTVAKKYSCRCTDFSVNQNFRQINNKSMYQNFWRID